MRAVSQRVETACLTCDAPMSVTPSRLADGRGRFCSVECAKPSWARAALRFNARRDCPRPLPAVKTGLPRYRLSQLTRLSRHCPSGCGSTLVLDAEQRHAWRLVCFGMCSRTWAEVIEP